jgi:hypothetical protein
MKVDPELSSRLVQAQRDAFAGEVSRIQADADLAVGRHPALGRR